MTAIRVELELADGSFTTRMLRAGQTIQQFNQSAASSSPALKQMAENGQNVVRSFTLADTASKGFMASLRDIAIVTGLVGMGVNKLINIQSTWVGSIVKVNNEFERLNYQMRSMSSASDPIREAADNVRYLRQQALDMPFRLSTINNAFVKLKATGTDPLNGSLQAIADGVAAFGGTDESFNRVVLGISQMSGKGVIQMEELRQQLGEQMPTAVAVMARSVGVSMSQLIRDISTGTVSSKETLAAFYKELDRSYGGRARYMMQTFEGQLKRVQTQLQNLALVAGGMGESGSYAEGSLMATLRQQLRDINEMLDGQIGQVIARDVGSALTAIVNFARSTINALIEFRTEIINVGQALAYAFVAKTAISGLATFGQALSVWSLKVIAARQQWTTLGTAITGQGFMNGLARTTSALALTAAVAAPAIVGVGLAIFAVAQYFDLFDDKGKDAIETLRKFGATSREQLDLADKHIEKQEQRLAQLNAERARSIRSQASMSLPGLVARQEGITRDEARRREAERAALDYDTGIGAERVAEAKRIEAELADARKITREAEAAFQKSENQRYVQAMQSAYDDEMRVQQNAYVARQTATQEHYNREAEKELAAGRSTAKNEEQRGQKILADQMKWHELQERELAKTIAKQQEILDANPVDRARHEDTIAAFQRQLLDVNAAHRAAASQVAGTPMIPRAADDQAAFEKGRLNLTRLKAEVKGLTAGLSGANAEVVELQEVLSNTTKYGHIEAEGVRELIQNLVEATAQKELLDELMEGKNKLEGDIERIRMRNIEREMELRERALGRELSESEKVKLRLEAGYYKGFGPESQTRKLLEGIVSSFDVQGEAADAVAKQIQEGTFGPRSISAINNVTTALSGMFNVINGIGTSLNGISFDQFNMPGDKFLNGLTGHGGPNVVGTDSGSILDLIAKRESGGDYNATLDHGRWTGGAQNLTAMTLNEVRALQKQMLANPENRAKYGNGKGSSALGRYQIVGQTLQGLMGEMGLSGNELYDGKMQDQMALRLLKRREGQGLTGLRNEWAGLNGVPDAQINAALGSGDNMRLPSGRTAAPAADPVSEGYMARLPQLQVIMDAVSEQQRSYVASIDAEIAKTKELDKTEYGVKRAEALEKLKIAAQTTSEDLDGLNKNYNSLVQSIKTGDMGANKDVGATEYRELIAAAKELDIVEKARADRKKALSSVNNAETRFAERQIELTNRVAEATSRMNDPNETKSSSAYRSLRQELESYVNDVEAAYGRDTGAFARAQEYKQQMLAQFRTMEVTESAAGWAKRTQDINRSLMTEGQRRQLALQDEITRIDAEVAAFQGTEAQKVAIVAQAEAQKAALRQQYQETVSPMAGMMREWGDLQGNLAKASTQWMGSLADGLTGLIMGTGDLKSVLQGILKDVLNMGIKYMMSQMMSGMGSKGAAAGGKGASGKGGVAMAGGKAATGKALPFLSAHTGGIIGSSRLGTRMASPSAFMGAPKFHTGGIIGGPRLMSDEVPIIAKKGEGVFTPEQMSALGGFTSNSVSIKSEVTVNSNGGTPEQNDDLARQVSRQVENQVRAVVQSEMQTAMRPGGIMSGRSR